MWLLTLATKASSRERRFPCRSPRKSCERWSRWNALSCKRTRSSPRPSAVPTCAAPPGAARSSPAICFVVGLGVLMAGAIGRITLVGMLGFVIMLVAGHRRRRQSAHPRPPPAGRCSISALRVAAATRPDPPGPAPASTGSSAPGPTSAATALCRQRRSPRPRATRGPSPVDRACASPHIWVTWQQPNPNSWPCRADPVTRPRTAPRTLASARRGHHPPSAPTSSPRARRIGPPPRSGRRGSADVVDDTGHRRLRSRWRSAMAAPRLLAEQRPRATAPPAGPRHLLRRCRCDSRPASAGPVPGVAHPLQGEHDPVEARPRRPAPALVHAAGVPAAHRPAPVRTRPRADSPSRAVTGSRATPTPRSTAVSRISSQASSAPPSRRRLRRPRRTAPGTRAEADPDDEHQQPAPDPRQGTCVLEEPGRARA